MTGAVLIRVAVPCPLYRGFDYRVADDTAVPGRGTRVVVPFGRQRLVGVVLDTPETAQVPASKLRSVHAILDPAPVIPEELLTLMEWTSRYYHQPIGETVATALPAPLRQERAAEPPAETRWHAADRDRQAGTAALAARAPRQAAVLARLQRAPDGLDAAALADLEGDWRGALRALVTKGLAREEQAPAYGLLPGRREQAPPALNDGQQVAVDAVLGALGGFQALLLDGVTGSGKTEVYLAAIDTVLTAGGQVLVLVPEIGLTPQLIRRFASRFDVPMAVMHSGLSDGERLGAWLASARGEARIVIGTRSAVFAPLARPGLIVVDEEHDLSFKQQDGVRYHARDLAVVRAQRLDVPIVLGSATPSLESLANVERARYLHLRLPERAGGARMPASRLLDIRGKPLHDGLSNALIERMRAHLGHGGQVLLFLNRRGYAPTLLCHECGWLAECPRCDARLTLHQRRGRLICHHCDYQRTVDAYCPDCGSADLRPVGQGTERLERALETHFPGVGRVRIDRDSTRRRGALERQLAAAQRPENRILLGTQMLAKGHHLPTVTLVAVVDADQGLFGSDFRAPERLAQLLVQVAGRAGRAERPGEVAIQTHHPEHPLLQTLLSAGYERFAAEALAERRAVRLPPYTAMALLRAEAVDPEPPMRFLESARREAERLAVGGVDVLGPVPAPMERRAGRYRAQLLLQAERRTALQRLLAAWITGLGALPSARRVRWSLDVDPMETL